MCVSKHVCCCKVSKSFGVGMFCQLGALCKALGKRNGFGDDVTATVTTSPMPGSTQHCVSCHTMCLSFLNSEWNSVPARNICCVCGINAFMFSPIDWAKNLPQCFHKSALKVHMIPL